MPDAVIVSAARTAVGTAFRGTPANATVEELGTAIVAETVRMTPTAMNEHTVMQPGGAR